MNVTLPWPPSGLSPNARLHWSKVAKLKKQLRSAWWAQAVEQGAIKLPDAPINVTLTFYPPDRRARDVDNMLSACKAGLDGLSDAIGVDDSKWTLTINKADTIGGMVKVSIESMKT
jgi:crossover junction endodeoxyribonuclease RusA